MGASSILLHADIIASMNRRQAYASHQNHFPLSSSMLRVWMEMEMKAKVRSALASCYLFLSFSRFRTLCYHTLQLHPTCLFVGSVAQLITRLSVWFSQDRAFVPIAIAQSSTDIVILSFSICHWKNFVSGLRCGARRTPTRSLRVIEKNKQQPQQSI